MTKTIPLDQAYIEAKKRGQEIGLSSLNCPFVTSSIHAQHFLTNIKSKFPETTSDVERCDALILWSDHMYDSFVKVHNVLTETGEFKKPVFIMEDGFLRSVDIYSSKNGIEYNKENPAEGFGFYDRKNCKWFDEDIRKAIMETIN